MKVTLDADRGRVESHDATTTVDLMPAAIGMRIISVGVYQGDLKVPDFEVVVERDRIVMRFTEDGAAWTEKEVWP